jgi:hypothetical protein
VTTFKVGDFLIDANGTITVVKKAYYASSVVEGPVYYNGVEYPNKLLKLATPEQVADWLAKKMLK